jgi:hypothetical protein
MNWFSETQQSRNIRAILDAQKAILDNQNVLRKQLEILTEAVYDMMLRDGPGEMSLTIEREDFMSLIYSLNLPTKSAPDVAVRRLSVTEGTNEPVLFELDSNVLVKEGLRGARDAEIHAELVDVDGNGNASPASVFDGVLVDTFPPPQPGEMGITVTGEE